MAKIDINEYLKQKLYSLKDEIDSFVYKTDRHKEVREQYNRLLKKIQKIDSIAEKIKNFRNILKKD